MKKNVDIEVLRAIAILTTMFVHLDILLFWGGQTLPSYYANFYPWGGVDLFFCISGYVIAGTLLRGISGTEGASRFHAVAIPFWIRRIWRILPAAWFWLAVVYVISLIFNRAGYMGTPAGNGRDSVFVLLQLANFHTWACFVTRSTACGVDQVYWSLSLEEQVYILLPLLLIYARRSAVVPILITIVVVQMFLPRPILSFLWFIRTDALALGVLLALFRDHALYKRFEPKIMLKPDASVFGLLIALTVLGMLSGLLKAIPFHTGLIALVAALMVWVASFDGGYIFPGGAMKRLLVYIGSRSYAIYLIHVPIYRVTREIWLRLAGSGATFDSRYTIPFMVTAWGLIFILAELNFRFIEDPLRRRGVRIAKRYSTNQAELVGGQVLTGEFRQRGEVG